MCVIICRGKNRAKLPKGWLDKAETRNPHGAGAVWWEGGRWHAVRLGEDEQEKLRLLLPRLAKAEAVAFHWRLATSGPRDRSCAHPFRAGSSWIMHNGVLSIPHDPRVESDTAALARALTKLPRRWWEDRDIRRLVQGVLAGDRLLVTDPDRPEFVLLGSWVERQGWHASNSTLWEPPVQRVRLEDLVAGGWVNYGGQLLPAGARLPED
jgi:hypothetical protein